MARISLLLNLVAGILMTVLGMGFSKPIVHFMGGEPEVEAVALDYYNILVLGTTAQALTYSVTASMRGAGQSRVPMIYNSVSNLLNVFGNYILIYGKLGLPAMGVIGAGYSTLFSRIICCILALIYVARSKKSPISLRHDYGKFRFEKNVVLRRVGQILRIGIPSALENLIMQCGSILFVKLVASLGTTMFSAHQVGNSLNDLTSAPSTAFSVTANTVCGQHIGAGEMDEAKNFKKYICRWALGVAAAMAIVVNVFSRQIIVLYTTDEDVIRFAGSILTIVSIQYITGFYNSTVMGSLRGAGDTRFAMIVNTVGLFCIRIPFSFLFAKVLHLGINGVWYSLLLQSWVNTVVISLRYKSGKWEDIYHKVNAEKPKKA